MFEKLKRIFCHHDWKYISFRQEIDGGIRYPIRRYHCKKCGKYILVDGRYDDILPTIEEEV